MSYTQKVVEGLSLQLIYRFLAAGLALLKLVILARVLTPTQFGLFSLVMVALGVTEAATETGINLTILHSKQPINYFLNTAWVISIVRGIGISVIMVFIGVGMNFYYNDTALVGLVFVASLVPIIRGFINPSVVTMQKELRFFSDSAFRTSLSIVEALSAIVLAIITRSVYALLAALIISASWEVLLSFILFKHKPKFSFNASRAKMILTQSKWLSASAILNYLVENADNLVIGKILGTTNLGYYDLGYRLSHKSSELARATNFSTLPVYIRVKTEPQRLFKAFSKTFLSTLTILGVLAVPLVFFPQITVFIFGQNWQPIVNSIPLLALAALIQSGAILIYTLFISKKQYSRITFHLLLSTVVMLVFVYLLSPQFGLVGAALGVLLSRIIGIPLLGWGVWKNIQHENTSN